LYLPWVLSAWLYYGTPIPHTIIAKSMGRIPNPLSSLFSLWYTAGVAFYPINARFGGWPWYLPYLGQGLATIPLFYWIVPMPDRLGRACSFTFFIGSWYLATIGGAAWYFPPVALYGLLTYSVFSLRLYEWTKPKLKVYALVAPVMMISIVTICLTWFLVATFQQMKISQEVIENGNRKLIGLWLKEHVQKNETVFVECLGYIGYFSGAHMLDFPGLASPRVAKLIREKKLMSMAALISVLNPDWTVLRKGEVDAMYAQVPDFSNRYHFVKRFDVTSQVNAYGNFPGRGYIEYDAMFEVYHRQN
jgi:hypothetical protein